MIDNTEDLDIVMPMYNLLEYNQNYSITSGSLWNYYEDQIDDVDDNASDGKLFIYKTKIVGNTPERPGNEGDANRPPVPTWNIEVTIPLKYLSNFCRYVDLPLINCELELDLSWTKDCVLIEQNNNITVVNFMITSTNLYVPVTTLSVTNNVKFLGNIKQGLKRRISWNKCRSEITTQSKKINLDYLIVIIDFIVFSFKTVIMILREILLKNITCHSRNQRF